MEEHELKRCTKCGEWKPRTEFHKSKAGNDGRYTRCKTCKNKQDREYRKRIPLLKKRQIEKQRWVALKHKLEADPTFHSEYLKQNKRNWDKYKGKTNQYRREQHAQQLFFDLLYISSQLNKESENG